MEAWEAIPSEASFSFLPGNYSLSPELNQGRITFKRYKGKHNIIC